MIGNPLLLGPEGYQISRSVRLRSSASAYFNRTPGSAGNQQKWTWSGWVKRGTLGSQQKVFFAGANSASFVSFEFIAGDNFQLFSYIGATNAYLVSTQVFRDPSAWYHIVVAADSTQATSSDRIKVYVNGSQITSFSTATYPSQNYNFPFNSAVAHAIGRDNANANNYFDGYFTELNWVDGSQLTPSSFGETDAITGVWKPKKYTGTYGTNGFFLKFSDNSSNTATTIGKDYSGNGNNWTPNNISVTSGSTYDSMLDVPTMWADGGNGRGNYSVLNPISNGLGSAPSNGNLRQSGISAVNSRINSTIGVSSGKWYFETTLTTAADYTTVGIGQNNITGQYPGNDALSYAQTLERATSINNNTQPSYGTALGTGDVFMCAFDLDDNKLFFGRNGTWFGSSDPAAGTNPVYTLTAGTYNAIARPNPNGFGSGGVLDFNFGQRPFAYTPPTGFKALNTQNLPEPVIKKGNQYFNATTYTGTNTTNSVVNSGGMQPDFVWIKNRGGAISHSLYDSVRGAGLRLASNETTAELNYTSQMTAFNSNGFTVATNNNEVNESPTAYVGWQWKEGATPGFDIVTYTGNGTGGRTISHSLGVTPKLYILKRRDAGGYNWIVQTTIIDGSLDYLFLNTTAAKGDSGDTPPTSSVFSVSGNADVNASGGTYVAYLFAEVVGFSKFGSYTGNGSSDGPFVFCGFRPRWIMVKRTDTVESWNIVDTARDSYNQAGSNLYPNLSNAESTNNSCDVVANGFKLRNTWAGANASGGTYIYAAFAEFPFRTSLAR